MNAFHPLRRLSPLAIVLIALSAVLTLTPTAKAQSSEAGQLEPIGLFPGFAAKAAGSGVKIVHDNEADFAQRWDRVKVGTNTYRFRRFGSLSCIRVPDTLPTSGTDSVQLGSCSGARAQWRRVPIYGGDLYVNAATRHYLAPDLCFIVCELPVLALNPSSAVSGLGLPPLRWVFDPI